MSIQKITLATALLLSITACSSGGKGGTTDNTARQENTKLQAQVKNLELKAEQAQKQLEQAASSNNKNAKELEALKQEAANVKKDAEKAKQDLQKQLSTLQTKADNAQKQAELANKQLEQAVNSNNKNTKELEALKQEAANAKKDAEKAKQDLIDVLENFDKRVIDTVKKTEKAEREKRNQLFEIARNSGLPEYEADRVARLYTDLDEEAFNNKLKEREERRKALTAQASKAGLQDWEINNFINSILDLEPQEAEKELSRLKVEKLKREQEQAEHEKTRNEIIKLALEYGLESWEANNFSYEFTDIAKAREELEARKQAQIAFENKKQELEKLATENGLESWEVSNFVSQFHNKTLDEAKAYFDKYKQIIAQAEDKGLDASSAKSFARSNIDQNDQNIAEALDNHIQEAVFNRKRVNDNTLTIKTPLGYTGKFTETVVPLRDKNGFETGETKLENYKDIYNQEYSLISGNYNHASYTNYEHKEYRINISGLETLEKNLPLEGTATYEGGAFAYERQGKLNYTVNFGTKEGQGTITEMPDIGTLTLEKSSIGKRYDRTMGIAGNVVAENWKNAGVTGSYLLDFYGPKAEEIAGNAVLKNGDRPYEEIYSDFNNLKPSKQYYDNLDIGFGGTRGEIKK